MMSAMGHKQTSRHARVMSVLPLKADIRQREWHVRYVPEADITRGPCPIRQSISNWPGPPGGVCGRGFCLKAP
jgi:hypothetical protein